MIPFVLEIVNDHFKRFVVFVRPFLHVHDDIAIHLNEPTITVPGEPLILGGLCQGPHSFIIQAKIQNRVHHAGHRIAGAGADRDEQRHGRFGTKLRAHDFFNARDGGFDLRIEGFRIGFLFAVIVGADFRCNSKTRRHRKTDAAHLG